MADGRGSGHTGVGVTDGRPREELERRRRLMRDRSAMSMNNHKLKVFSGRANIPLAEKTARHLGDALGKVTLTNFPDGELSVRIDEDVRGRDIYVVQPTCPPVNENLMELLTLLDAFKR